MAEPWFRMHANPTKLKVTARLMEYAKIDKMRAVGHLATFWGAVSQHCPGGTIVGIPDSLIEEWADWKSKKGVFASFVRLLHSADGKINDYEEYSGVLDVTREKNRKRKQEQRDKERQSRGRHADVTEDSHAPKDVTSEATIRNDTKRYETTKKHPRASAPWMGSVQIVWSEVFPGGAPPKGTAKTLAPLFAKHPEIEVCDWLRQYLRSTNPQYLNLSKAAATYSGPQPRYIRGDDEAAVRKALGMDS